VGKVLNKLKEKNLLDDTLIIFTSDNGLMAGAHNIAGKNVAYEESIRIPLFVRYPKLFPAGLAVSDDFTLNIDIVPTILEAASVQIPARLPGISLHKFAIGAAQRQCFLYENFRFELPRGTSELCFPNIRAIRTRDCKYVTYFDPNQKDELYDLNKDPIEADNLINDPAYQVTLQRLRFQLDSLRIAADDSSLISPVAGRNGKPPLQFMLFQNHPNPFNPATTISYALPVAIYVSLKVYNIHGQEVATIVDEFQEAGTQTIRFDASRLSNGIYFYRLLAGAFNQTRKMVVMK
jgi:hypothetical protein